jgi:HPt (histidine-containing phosphotransfer) domain-containing protein
MNDHLAKPYRKEDLVHLIKGILLKTAHEEAEPTPEPVTVPEEVLYTLDDIREISGGDESFVVSIVETFRTNTPDYIRQMNLGLAKGDFEVLKKYAHQMKPSLDILGMKEGSRLIRLLEEECAKSTKDKELISHYFDQIKQILDVVLKDLYSKF